MIFFPILLFISLYSLASCKVGDLTWKDHLVTKESIIENHNKIKSQPIFDDVPTLAFITTYNARGYRLARLAARRLTHVSPVWFSIEPQVKNNFQLVDVQITGTENINLDYVRALRKLNPNIKIVPRFKFESMNTQLWELFAGEEILVQRTAQKLVNFCQEYGFDGLVLEIFNGLAALHSNGEEESNTLESLTQIGNFVRSRGLIAILAIPAPVPMKPDSRKVVPSEEAGELLKSFDFIQIWTYTDVMIHSRKYGSEEWFYDCIKLFHDSPKVMLGFNYYGTEFNLAAFKKGDFRSMKDITAKRYLEIVEDEGSVLEWNDEAKEHELILKNKNTVVLFPSLTSLEWRIRVAREKNVAISFWEMGQGLDYFANLL